MSPSASGTFETLGGVRLAWLRWDADEPVALVVIVHGLGDHAGRYGPVAAALVARGFSVFAHDHRGHGRSPGLRGHAAFGQLFIDLERAVAFASSGAADLPVFLWGHSLGGLITIRYLQLLSPAVEGAVITAPWLKTLAPVPAWKRRLASVLDRVTPWLALSTGTRPELLMRDPERIRAFEQDPLVHSRISPRLYHGSLDAQRKALDRPDLLRLPTLFLVPEADPLVDPAVTLSFAESIPDGDVRVIPLPGLLHEPHNEPERGDVFLAAGDWLDRRLAR